MSDSVGEVAVAGLFIASLMFMHSEYGTMRACKALSQAAGNDYARVSQFMLNDIRADNRKPEDRETYNARLNRFSAHLSLADRLGPVSVFSRPQARAFFEAEHREWTAFGCYTTLFLGEIWYGGDIAAAYPDIALL